VRWYTDVHIRNKDVKRLWSDDELDSVWKEAVMTAISWSDSKLTEKLSKNKL
jgi:hypothetical protein